VCVIATEGAVCGWS